MSSRLRFWLPSSQTDTSLRTSRPASVAAETVRQDLSLRNSSFVEFSDDPLDHRRWAGQEIRVAAQIAQLLAKEVGIDLPRLPLPLRIPGHGRDESEAGNLLFELGQLVQKCGRLPIAVGIDERDLVGLTCVGDVAKHASENRDPDPAGDEDVMPLGILGEPEVALGLLDLDLGADLELGERALERRVADPRAEPQDSPFRRRRDDRDMAPGAFLVLVRRVEHLDPEVLARPEV